MVKFSDDVSELTNLAKQTDAANRYLDDVAELERLVAQDWPAFDDRIKPLERSILETVPRSHQQAASIVAVASTSCLADLRPDMINATGAALDRVGAYLDGVPAANDAGAARFDVGVAAVMLTDPRQDIQDLCSAALKRVAAYLGGVPAASAAYYGVAAAA